jgi:tetratricopeptide (TPR) repeat protein
MQTWKSNVGRSRLRFACSAVGSSLPLIAIAGMISNMVQVAGICLPPVWAASESIHQQLDQIQSELEAEQPLSSRTLSRLEKILQENPDNYRAKVLLGREYEKLGLTDQATEQYRQAARDSPRDPHSMVEMITALVKAGQLEAAGEILHEAKRRYPQDAEIEYWEGNFLYTQKDMVNAEKAYNSALLKNPKIVGLNTAMAEVNYNRKKYWRAYLDASKDIALQPTFWSAYKIRGFAALELGFYHHATRDLQRAFAFNPWAENVSSAFANAAYRAADYETALEPALVNLCIKTGIDYNPLQSKRLVLDIWRRAGNKNSLPIYQSTEKKYNLSNKPSFCFAMGDVLDRLGLPSTAIVSYQAGLAKMPSFSRGLFRAGRDLEVHEHRYDQALRYYRRAFQSDDTSREIYTFMQRLESRLSHRDEDLAWQLKDFGLRLGRIFGSQPGSEDVGDAVARQIKVNGEQSK